MLLVLVLLNGFAEAARPQNNDDDESGGTLHSNMAAVVNQYEPIISQDVKAAAQKLMEAEANEKDKLAAVENVWKVWSRRENLQDRQHPLHLVVQRLPPLPRRATRYCLLHQLPLQQRTASRPH